MSDHCPKCGYPDTFDGEHYKGIYTPGKKCSNCEFIDVDNAFSPSVRELVDEMLSEKKSDRKTLRMFYLLLKDLRANGLQALYWPKNEYVWDRLKGMFE